MIKRLISISLIVITIVFLWSGDMVFAAWDPDLDEYNRLVTQILDFLVNFLSRGWIILANLAGRLMSNDLVYGSVFGLDVILWKIRNLMRTFANFTIGFWFLWLVLQEVFQFGTGDSQSSLSSKVGKFLLAGVGINVSRFVIGALLDISTILIATIGAFPSIFLSTEATPLINTTSVLALKQEIPVVMLLSSSAENTTTQKDMYELKPIFTGGAYGRHMDDEAFLDYITPQHNSLGWPLVFIGMSILKLQNYSQLTQPEWMEKTIMATIIRFGVLVLYSIIMIVLVVVNLVRIGFIWIVVMMSPFIVIVRTIGKDIGIPDNLLWNNLSFDAIWDYMFRPVIITAYMSLMFVLVIAMSQLMLWQNRQETIQVWGTTIQWTKMEFNNIAVTEYDANLIPSMVDGAKTTIIDLILVMITLYLLYLLIQLSIQGSNLPLVQWLVSDKGLITQALWSIPLIPGKGWVWVSYNLGKKYLEAEWWIQWDRMGWGLFSKYQNELENKNRTELSKIRSRISGDTKEVDYDAVRSKFSTIYGTSTDVSDLTNYIKTLQSDTTLKDLSIKNYRMLDSDLLTWIKKMKGKNFPGTQTSIKDFTTDTKFSSLQAVFDDINDATQWKRLMYAIESYIKGDPKLAKEYLTTKAPPSQTWQQFSANKLKSL